MKRIAWCIATVSAASLVAAPSHAQPDGTAVNEIRDYLGRLEKLGFAGSVVISKAGQPILASGYGLAEAD